MGNIKQEAIEQLPSYFKEPYETVADLQKDFLTKRAASWGEKASEMWTFAINPKWDPNELMSPTADGWQKVGRTESGEEVWAQFNIAKLLPPRKT